MLMFCGDSHARQFHFEAAGQYSFNSFTGASMKGLGTVAGPVGHRETILALAAAPRPKTLFLMFGNVDLDVTYYRKLAQGKTLDEADFFAGRLATLSAFVDTVLASTNGFVDRVCTLLPHVPTLNDEYFPSRTAIMARLPEEAMVQLATHVDCSHVSRCRRTARFNDLAMRLLPVDARRATYRVDDLMVDADGLIRPEFVRRSRKEHHAAYDQTLLLWQRRLQDEVPFFKRMVERRDLAETAVIAT